MEILVGVLLLIIAMALMLVLLSFLDESVAIVTWGVIILVVGSALSHFCEEEEVEARLPVIEKQMQQKSLDTAYEEQGGVLVFGEYIK